MNGNDSSVTKSDLLAAIQELKEYIDERTHDAETRLLRAFSDYNSANGIRLRKIEADVSNIDTSSTQRLGKLEEQVTDLTLRLMRLEGEPPSARQDLEESR